MLKCHNYPDELSKTHATLYMQGRWSRGAGGGALLLSQNKY